VVGLLGSLVGLMGQARGIRRTSKDLVWSGHRGRQYIDSGNEVRDVD
jgi:hypothetical protein